jgi:glycosyltransferase involved in cell wall biosynthesis
MVHFWDVHFAFAYSGLYVASLQHSFRQRWSIWQQGGDYLPLLAYRFTYYELARLLAEMPSVHRAQGLLAGSIATRDEYIQHYGILSERIALARHGIDVDFFRPRPGKNEIRSELGLGPNDPVILFVGFVTPRKGLDYLARALTMIRPAPYLIVVGQWSENYRAHFLGLLGPLASRVIEAGFVPDEKMPTYYSMADVYVSTSLLEGFGLALAESLACETPAVAADGGATAEVVGPGGIIIPPRDSTALANAVSTLLQDPSLRDRLGKDGREHIKREFTVQKMVGDTLRAYEEFLESPSSSAST